VAQPAGGLDEIPVFARAGAIVALADPGSGEERRQASCGNPRALCVHVFPGADNHFELYEDDGESSHYRHGAQAVTPLRQEWSGSALRLRIGPVRGDPGVLPGARGYTLVFHAIDAPGQTACHLRWRAPARRYALR
jgi:hypothetical protein